MNSSNSSAFHPAPSNDKKEPMKLTIKRGSSNTRLVKLKQGSAPRESEQAEKKLKLKVKPVKKQKELYGLDLDLIADLGLGDYLEELESSPEQVKPHENMSYE